MKQTERFEGGNHSMGKGEASENGLISTAGKESYK